MSTAALAQQPAHVPNNLVVDFDVISDANSERRWPEGLSKLFAEVGPIFWTPRRGGHWVVGGYDALFELARNPAVFGSDSRKYPPEENDVRLIPIRSDAPEHAGYRKPIDDALAPPRMASLKSGIRTYAASLIDKFAKNGRVDAFSAFAELLPVVVFLRLMGLPTDRVAEFRELMVPLLVSADSETRNRAFERIAAICGPVIRARMQERQDDLISRLIDAPVAGRAATFEEVMAFVMMLYTAGLDTVVNSLSFGLYHLGKDQELQSQLRKDPSLIPSAIEEFLRVYGIVCSWRYVLEDTELRGVRMKAHEKVVFCTPAANQDASVYTDPAKVDLTREARPHLAFLVGPHRCAGSHLARMEMTIGYEEFLKAIPQFRLDPDKVVEPRQGYTFGLHEVPLVWDASATGTT